MISNFILETGQQSVTFFTQLVATVTMLIFHSGNPLQKIIVFTYPYPPSCLEIFDVQTPLLLTISSPSVGEVWIFSGITTCT